MDQKSAKLHKSFDSIFLLEKSKLSRLLNIIEEKYKGSGLDPKSIFEITLKNGKKMSVHDIEYVLGHDNAVKNPITHFSLKYSCSINDDITECEVIYNKVMSSIDIFIESVNVKWANELFAEIEEQIERIIVKSFVYSFKRQILKDPGLLVIIIGSIFGIITMSIVLTFLQPQPSSGKDFLLNSDVQHILTLSKNAKSNDDKIGVIYEYYITRLTNINIKEKGVSFIDIFHKFDLKIILILLPLLIIVISGFYLFRYCYPGSIFLWGDYEDHYNDILNRRKIVSNTIIITLLIGIIGNLFVYGFSKFFS